MAPSRRGAISTFPARFTMSEEIQVKVTRSGSRRFLIMYFDDPASGKRIQRSTKQTRQKDAEKEAGKWEAELRSGQYKPPSKVTWDEFRERFETHLRGKRRKTFVAYSTAMNAAEKYLKLDRL